MSAAALCFAGAEAPLRIHASSSGRTLGARFGFGLGMRDALPACNAARAGSRSSVLDAFRCSFAGCDCGREVPVVAVISINFVEKFSEIEHRVAKRFGEDFRMVVILKARNLCCRRRFQIACFEYTTVIGLD